MLDSGRSTVFGALIVFIGVGVMSQLGPWLRKMMEKKLSRTSLLPALEKGASVLVKVDRLSKPWLLVLTHGASTNRFNGFMLFVAGVLLMAPFSLVPFSNNTSAGAGGAVLRHRYPPARRLRHPSWGTATVGTIAYFSVLIFGAIQGGRAGGPHRPLNTRTAFLPVQWAPGAGCNNPCITGETVLWMT